MAARSFRFRDVTIRTKIAATLGVLVLIIFGIIVLIIFRSTGILIGSVISCISASMWTLMIVHMLGIKIGLLTANLATIVFVLTLSHIIFLTYNWKYVCAASTMPVKAPVTMTTDCDLMPMK